ncbi:uncharacterized protein ZSWIM9-like [Ascaphus truei]|uniref:uncharacterized protein ZSWIM9-like n=1 Tax=Ascaphus truei TaxID=8439 RepID=UPI003F5A1639
MDESELQLKEFFSWEECSAFFDAWCEERKVLFFVKNSMPLSKCKWASEPLQPEVVEALKYSSLRLACKDVYGTRKRAQGKPKEQTKQRKGCGAYIVLRMSQKKNSLIVTECQLNHNHVVCPLEFAYYFKKGYLLANSCLPVRTTNKISKQFVAAQEIKRLLSYCKTKDNGVMDTLHALDNLFTNDPGTKVKLVFIEDKVIVKTVFFVTSLMRSLLQRFPPVLFFDRIVSFNEEFDLYGFICADANSRGRDCAYVLARKGTPNILRFALASLVQSVPDVKFKVRCVTLGIDIGEKEVVMEILPHARVQIFRSQVLQTLFRKAHEMDSAEDKKIWPLLCDIAASATPEAYSQAMRNMDLIFSKSFMKYYKDQWHSCREMWVEIWALETAQDLNPSELISQHKQKLIAGLHSNATVAECILDLMLIQTPKEDIQNLNDDEVATRYRSICNAEPASMIEEELGSSRHGAYDIKETTNGFSLSDGVSEFFMDQELVTCSCTIHVSSLLPCRHLFATRLQNGEALFDLKLLQKNTMALTKIL